MDFPQISCVFVQYYHLPIVPIVTERSSSSSFIRAMTMQERFRESSRALQTGQNYAEASHWFNTLVEQKEECLLLCFTIISTADAIESTPESIFMAANIVHTFFFRKGYYASQQVDPTSIQVLIWALFQSEKLLSYSQENLSGGAAYRQLSLCLASSLAVSLLQTTSSSSQLSVQIIETLTQLTTASTANLQKVLRIVEELPTELSILKSKVSCHAVSPLERAQSEAALQRIRELLLMHTISTSQQLCEHMMSLISVLSIQTNAISESSHVSSSSTTNIATNNSSSSSSSTNHHSHCTTPTDSSVLSILGQYNNMQHFLTTLDVVSSCLRCVQVWCSTETAMTTATNNTSSTSGGSRSLLSLAYLISTSIPIINGTQTPSQYPSSSEGGSIARGVNGVNCWTCFEALVHVFRCSLRLANILAPGHHQPNPSLSFTLTKKTQTIERFPNHITFNCFLFYFYPHFFGCYIST